MKNLVKEKLSACRSLILLLILFLTIAILVPTAVVYYVTAMPGRSYSGPQIPMKQDEIEIRDRLKKHAEALAGDIGERNVSRYRELDQAARYIQETFESLGYKVSRQNFQVDDKVVSNIEVELTGVKLPEEIVVIGAHYDSARGTPGANDNATGVAAALELARLLRGENLARTVRLVAFVNEERPFFETDLMGSRVYARRSRGRGEKIVGMLSLETIGYYSDEEGSQKYPFPFSYFYPSEGNFIGFVGNLSSRGLVRKCVSSFRKHARFPSEGVAAPERVPGVGWSDHWAFWQEGYNAVMVTDTAPFRYKHYHTPEDTTDKIDYSKTACVVSGLRHVTIDLAGIDK